MILLIMPLVFAGITGSTPQNKEEVVIDNEEDNNTNESCDDGSCDSEITIKEIKENSEENSITGSATEESESKGFFEKLIDWIKNLFG